MKMVAEFEVENPKKVEQLTLYLDEVSKHMALVKFLGLKETENAQPAETSVPPLVQLKIDGDVEDQSGEPFDDGKVSQLAGTSRIEPTKKPKRRNQQNRSARSVRS